MLFLAFMEKFLSADSKIPWLLLLLLCITDSYERACHSHACELIKRESSLQKIKIGLNNENVAMCLRLLMI